MPLLSPILKHMAKNNITPKNERRGDFWPAFIPRKEDEIQVSPRLMKLVIKLCESAGYFSGILEKEPRN